MKGKSNSYEPHQASVSTTLKALLDVPLTGEKSFTVELALGVKRQTLKARSNTFVTATHRTSLLKTSEAVLTSNEKDLTPYWTTSSEELSQKLLSLTKTGLPASDLILSNPLQVNTTARSWFLTSQSSALSKNLSMTYFPSSMFSPAVFTASENTLVRSKKTRIYPKKAIVIKFKCYFGLSRYWFNAAVAYLKQPDTKAALKLVRKIQQNEHPDWAFNCPQRIREHAIYDACKAVKNAKLKFKKTGMFQQVQFRKKDHKLEFHASEPISSDQEGTRIICEDHRYFLITPQRRYVQKPENQRLPFVALDPGVRTFMSFYSPYAFGKIGEGDFKPIYRLCLGLDNLYSKMKQNKARKRKRFKLACERMRWKIYDLIDDLHKKTAHFLVTRFEEILIPSFETSEMVTKLRSKSARSMLTFAHFRFRTFLQAKAEEYSCKVRIVSEAYTSKTCSYSGHMQNIGSKPRLKCICGVNVDRDFNGARGIYLRALGATPWFKHLFKPAIVNLS